MKKTIIFEKGDGELWGRIEGIPDYLANTAGKDVAEIEENMRGI